jgi:hypothetical protein
MANNKISRSRLFTPSVIRRIVDSSEKIKNQTLSHLSGSSIGSDRSFKFDAPGTGLKSTQQLNIDWSRFENHTFFNSAEAKVNTAFDEIINNYPFDGSRDEVEAFFDKLTGFEKYVFDQFPKRTGDLHFRDSYIAVPDRAGALFPSLSELAANPVLDPREESLSLEMHIFVPPGSEGDAFSESEKYNGNQIICQKLDVFGETGFTLALLDSRLKNRNVQSTLGDIPVWSGPGFDGIAIEGVASLFQRHNSNGNRLWTYTVLDTTVPASEHFKLDGLGNLFVDDADITADASGHFIPFMHNQYSIVEDPAYIPVLEEADYGKDVCDITFLISSGSTAYLSASMELAKGRWNHICASYDRTYGENNIKMYLDSVLTTTSDRSYNMADLGTMIDEDDLPSGYDAISFHVAPLLIGSGSTHLKGTWGKINETDWDTGAAATRYDENGYPTVDSDGIEAADIRPLPGDPPVVVIRTALVPGQMFSGSLDEFRLWHAPRSEGVLRHKGSRNIFSGQDDSLRLYYRFNEPAGHYDQNEVVLDSGGEGLHAKITNYDPGDAMDIEFREPGLREIMLYPPANGQFGDPEDPLKTPMRFEKAKLSPILFPSHPDVITLNQTLLDEAGWYDTNNPNLITKLVPPHYLLEAQADNGLEHILGEVGAKFTGLPGMSIPGGGELGQPHLIASLLFTWARYFDEIKMFLDHFVNVLHVDYNVEETVADTFLPFVANYYGFDLPRVFSDAAIPQYMDGENITPDQSLSDLSLQYVQNQIWRRVLTNMNEIIQSKGTHHGIRALMLSIGINPDKLFRFREYGGSRTKDLQDIRRHRTEISAVLDFSTTIDNPAGNATGSGNLLAGFYPPGGATDPAATGIIERNPWEGVIGDVPDGDNLTDMSQVNWIKPLMMSPFLSGSRGEVGAVSPDTDIPQAWMQIEIDFSLGIELPDVVPTPTEHYATKLMLLESSILNRKVIELEDLDGTTFMFELMTDDDEQLDSESYIRIGLDGILDRVEIAEKIVEVINKNSTFEAYNVSEENNGKIKVSQPRGGRAGNLPIKMWQYTDDVISVFTGEQQLVTDDVGKSVDETLWKRPDAFDGGSTQLTEVDGKLLWRKSVADTIGVARGGVGSTPQFTGYSFTDSPAIGAGAMSWQVAIDAGYATADDAHALGIFNFSSITPGRGASADEKIAVDADYEPMYSIPLSVLGYDPAPQILSADSDGNMVPVWKSLETGEVRLETDIEAEFGPGIIPATYEKYLRNETEEQFAEKYGYVPIMYDKKFVNIVNPVTGITGKFSGGARGLLRYDHPDVSSEEEKVFIQEQGTFHGFDFTPSDGLFTSGSWTAEATYRYDKPTMTFYPVTQSLLRIHSTADVAENHVVLANLVAMRYPTFDADTGTEIITNDGKVKLFVSPGWDAADSELELTVENVNIFNGQMWHVSFGRDRADQHGSEVSSSYFLRVGRNHRGEIKEYHEDRELFQETLLDSRKTFWSDLGEAATGKNEWGPFIVVGSQDLPSDMTVGSVGLNSDSSDDEKVATHFSGRIAQLRFWSKGLTTKEAKEHVRNPFSVGVESPGTNFNFALTNSGSFERLRLDVSFDQPMTGSTEDELADRFMLDPTKPEGVLTPLGWIELFDFSQARVTGSRGAIWRDTAATNDMPYHMMGYGFYASGPGEEDVMVIKPERFDYTTIDAKFDEHGVDNKIRIRGYQETDNIEEFQTDMAPVYEILKSETPNDDTRFSIDVSSFQGLNDDIIKIFATLDTLDNMIGAPELVFATGYPSLRALREVYFNRLTGQVNIKSFFEFFKWFDSAVGTMIEKLIPRKTHFMGVNFVIESHMLERAKLTYNYSDTYLGSKNRHGLKGTITLQQFVGQVKRF